MVGGGGWYRFVQILHWGLWLANNNNCRQVVESRRILLHKYTIQHNLLLFYAKHALNSPHCFDHRDKVIT